MPKKMMMVEAEEVVYFIHGHGERSTGVEPEAWNDDTDFS